MRTARVRRSLVFIALCLVGVTTVYPLIFMALNSMRTSQQYEVSPYGLPTSRRSCGPGENFSDFFKRGQQKD